MIPYPALKGLRARREFARRLRGERFDGAILLQNAFDAALIAWLAGIPERIGYNRDARGWLLTKAVPVPEPGDIPRHQRFYYLELLRRAGMLERFPNARYWGSCEKYANCTPIWANLPDDGIAAYVRTLARIQETAGRA